jgi:hypothetical protein
MQAMQTQWSWLLQLTMCLETHLKYASSYYQVSQAKMKDAMLVFTYSPLQCTSPQDAS